MQSTVQIRNVGNNCYGPETRDWIVKMRMEWKRNTEGKGGKKRTRGVVLMLREGTGLPD